MSQDFRPARVGLALAAVSMAFAGAGRAAALVADEIGDLALVLPEPKKASNARAGLRRQAVGTPARLRVQFPGRPHDHARANARRRRQIAAGILRVSA